MKIININATSSLLAYCRRVFDTITAARPDRWRSNCLFSFLNTAARAYNKNLKSLLGDVTNGPTKRFLNERRAEQQQLPL